MVLVKLCILDLTQRLPDFVISSSCHWPLPPEDRMSLLQPRTLSVVITSGKHCSGSPTERHFISIDVNVLLAQLCEWHDLV